MGTVRDLLDALKWVDLSDMGTEVIKEQENQYLDINRDNLLQGLDVRGDSLPYLKWDRYIDDKSINRGGSPFTNRTFERYTLNYSGELFRRMYVDFDGGNVRIASNVPYVGKFANLDVFGVNLNSPIFLEYKRLYFMPRLVELVKQQLDL